MKFLVGQTGCRFQIGTIPIGQNATRIIFFEKVGTLHLDMKTKKLNFPFLRNFSVAAGFFYLLMTSRLLLKIELADRISLDPFTQKKTTERFKS